jgi:hypothetical protein
MIAGKGGEEQKWVCHGAHSPRRPRRATPEPAIAGQPPEPAGAVQKVLHGLGITGPGLLQRAADIDHASEQPIIESAGQGGMRH